jgi:signal transduction histidine kinase
VLVGSLLFLCVFGAISPPLQVAASGDAVEPPVKRVLILQSFGSDFTPYDILSSSFRSELAHSLGEPVAFHEVMVTADDPNDSESERELTQYLDALGAERPPDLAVTIGGLACRFVRAHRERLFPATPVLFAGVTERLASAGALAEGDAVAPVDDDSGVLFGNILQVLPRTETVAVITGSSSLERFWRSELGRDLEPFEKKVHILWWDDLTGPEILSRASALPPRSAIFYVLFLIDGAGVPFSNETFLGSLHEAASAPIFGVFDTQVGNGIVGGRLMPVGALSRRAVEAAAGILQGRLPVGIRLPTTELSPPIYDGRELERWGIPESTLPSGSTVAFKQPPLWVAYRWPVFGGLGVIIVLALLVIALNIHRVRLSRAEYTVRDLSRRLLTGVEEVRRQLGRELHDDVAQRLASFAIDSARIEGQLQAAPEQAAEVRSLREQIIALSTDVHALSRWLHPSVLDDLGLIEALRTEADRFSRVESINVEVQLTEPDRDLSSEVALCLYRVAQQALQNVAHHAAARTAAVSLRPKDRGCELEIRDDGVGFDPERSRGRGLGLASMAERVQLVGGRFTVTSAPGRGASVVAWAPLEGGRDA